MKNESEFNFIQRIMLQHANPIKLTSDCIGVVLCFYFLWINNLVLALIFLFGLSLLGNILVWKTDIKKSSETPLGKWMLGQAQPINLIVRTVGFFVVLFAIWRHSFPFMVLGIVIIALGRIFGAKRIIK